ncbi:MAG: hypothetical protein VYA84_06740 [Planctomycetota bacterium]|nr:hypothetical protein [Planctomycetota bacterium]
MRSSLAILCTIATLFSSGNGASACGLTDWLFGRNQPVYAVGYAPVAVGTIPVDAGPQLAIGPRVASAPFSSVPMIRAAAPVATGPRIVGIPPVTTARPVVLMPAPMPVSQNGVYQAQRPAYVDNPSVYTGQPVYRGQPVYSGAAVQTSGTAAYAGSQPVYSSKPATGTVQANYQVAPANPYTSATSQATVNPLPYRGQVPVTSYRPDARAALPGAPLTVTTPTGLPATALPPTQTQVTPLFPQTPPQPPRGLRGLFSRWFGTGYQTSYYTAPVTYYRPVTAVDPVSGGAVIVQQPCASTELQVQRTPFTTFQSPPPTYSPAPCATSPSACPTPLYSYPSFASGIGQVGAVGAMGQGATSIPSTLPNGSYGQAGGYETNGGYNMTPLQGAPPALPPIIQSAGPSTGVTGSSTGDLAPIERPQLNSGQANGLAIPPAPSATGAGSNAIGAGSSAIGSGGAINESTNGTTNGRVNGAETNDTNGSGFGSGDASDEAPSNYWELQNADDSTAMIRPRSNYSMNSQSQSLGGRVEPIAAPEDYSSPFRGRSGAASSIPAITPPPVESKQFEAPPLPARSPIGPTELTSVSIRAPVTNRVQRRATPRRDKPRDSTWYPVNP